MKYAIRRKSDGAYLGKFSKSHRCYTTCDDTRKAKLYTTPNRAKAAVYAITGFELSPRYEVVEVTCS